MTLFSSTGYNVEKLRQDFPILGKPVIYFDNACMSLKPQQVIDKLTSYYTEHTACAGRSSHAFATKVEDEVTGARRNVKKFINAKHDEEIIFTRNTTEGINLVANCCGLTKNDRVIISDKEHNSNLIPWLKQAKKGITVVAVTSNPDNTFNLERFAEAFTQTTKLVSIVHTSNLDGVTNPIKEIAKIAHEHDALVLVDGAQSVPSQPVDVQTLKVDFLSFSGHKMCGPTGTGALYGKKAALEQLDQFLVGGETVIDATYTDYQKEEVPMRFEAGLQDYAGILGLGEACTYLKKIGLEKIAKHELMLNKLMSEELLQHKKVQLIGPQEAAQRGGIFSFNIAGVDPHHVAQMLDVSKHIMTRSGAHCVHSWFNKHQMKGSVRASVYFYNTPEEVAVFVDQVKKIARL
ncbi:cysteine desulfurase [Candidatus Woesearchaeota archaeon]|nr:cysteine desulfurase [Candidatus Woesearchaeota archaeon]